MIFTFFCGVESTGLVYTFLLLLFFQTLLYVIQVMDSVVDSDYVVVYFHTQTTGRNHIAMAYFKMAYGLLDYR